LAVVFFFFITPKRQYSHILVKERLKNIDIVGAVFLICAIVLLLLALKVHRRIDPKPIVATILENTEKEDIEEVDTRAYHNAQRSRTSIAESRQSERS
jgi:hypothetical protein